MRGYELGAKLLVVTGGDPHTGRVGVVENTFTDDDGDPVYAVRFCGDRDNFPHHLGYYLRDEVEPAPREQD